MKYYYDLPLSESNLSLLLMGKNYNSSMNNNNTTWNLPHYFYESLNDPRIDVDIATWLPLTQEYAAKYRDKIKLFNTPEEVLEFYEYGEKLDMIGKKTLHYLSYLSSLDTQDTEVQKKIGEIEYLSIQLSELTLFIAQEWKVLGVEKIRSLAESPILRAYRNDLLQTADTIQYLLSEEVESVLNKKSRALGILGLHEELRSSFLFPWSDKTMKNDKWIMNNEGETKYLTEEEIRAFARSPDREIRKKASESMQSVYLIHQNQITFGNLYTSIVKNWSTSMDMRGYDTVMSKRNISEQLSDTVVDTLMSNVQNHYDLYQRFLVAKRKHLGVSELYGYDTAAPVYPIQKKIPYEEAQSQVLDMFQSFDSRFADYARSMMEDGRVDVFPKPWKRWGAFASYDKWVESFVLLNYTETINDVFTLAHELGHAIHGHFAQVQTSPVYHAPLVLAETASIFSENLLMDRIQDTFTPAERAELLNQKLMDVFGSIHRQIMYVSFEKRVHERIHAWWELTYKELNLWWDEESKKLSGSAITPILTAEKNYTWSAIPHIFSTPFYCYAYSFGMLVALSLLEKYHQEGSWMIEGYFQVLSAGGSVPPVELLQSIWIDPESSEFYDSAFTLISRWVEEFEALV